MFNKNHKSISVRMALVLVLIVGVFEVIPAHANAETIDATISGPNFLNDDGTLKLDESASSSFQADAWDVQLDPDRGPIFSPKNQDDFSPLAATTAGTWSALGSDLAGTDGAISYSESPSSTQVFAIVISGTDVYVGGCFKDAGGNPTADFVAKWDGVQWSGLGNNGSIPADGAIQHGCVKSLNVSGSNVYIGAFGEFKIGNNPNPLWSAVAKWDGTTWSSVGNDGAGGSSIPFGRINAIMVSGSTIYFGGNFTDVKNGSTTLTAADYIAKWDGTNWSALGSGFSGNGALNGSQNATDVQAIAVHGSDLYVGGNFTQVLNGSTPVFEASYIAKWDGMNWSAVGSGGDAGTSLNGRVSAIAVNGSDLYVGGSFTDVRNGATTLTEADYIAKWDGANWSALGSNGSGNGALYAEVPNAFVTSIVARDGDIYVAGNINVNNHGTALTAADYVAKWDGTNWSALGSNGSGNGALNNGIYSLAISGDKLYAGGVFTNVNNNGTVLNTADYIAAYDMCSSPITVQNTNDSGAGSLRQAIADICSGGTINFDPSLSGQTIYLASTLTLSRNVTIDGSALASQITISGDDLYRVFYINSGITVTLDSLKIAHGVSPYGSTGGGIYNAGTLTVTNSTISENSAAYGGGTFNEGGTVTMIDSILSHNDAYMDGSGLYTQGGIVTVSHSTFSNNNASFTGGGMYNAGGAVIVSHSTFSSNSGDPLMSSYAGGIYNNGTLTISDGIFSNNSAQASGGGIFHGSGTLTITNSIFAGNSAGIGGGIINNATLTVTNSAFLGNSAESGGGIYNNGTLGKLTVTDSSFSENSALDGGGIFNYGTLTATNNTFSGNGADVYDSYGGGISNYDTATVMNSTFFENIAYTGGGIHNWDTLTVTNSTFDGNEAGWGGGIANSGNGMGGIGGTLTVRNSTFSANGAQHGGGIANVFISSQNSVLHFVNTIIANSTSGGDCYDVGDIGNNINNLVEDGSCSASMSGDPKLAPSADNGGLTPTMALGAGSPAIDTGDDTNCPGTDQRGVTRPQGSHCDIGAYEKDGVPIDIHIAGAIQGTYNVVPGTSRRVMSALNNGPVKVTSTNAVPFLVAERDAWLLTGVVQSFSEMMGLPSNQVTDTYYFPWYNNVTMDTQLRFANLGNTSTNITVTIAGVPNPPITVPAGQSTRVSYPVNNGPVKVQSSGGVPIIVAERDTWLLNGVVQSFSEMMGLPGNKVTDTYYFPWYNNVTMDTQLRFANLGNTSTNITVTIAGVAKPAIPLAAGQSTRVSYPVNNGPVKVTSTGGVPIIVAERDAWLINGVVKSFSEMMGLPGNQLTDTYHFPWYNNVTMDTQLRFANLGNISTDITVTIAGVAQPPITVAAGTSTRISYPVNNGPVTVTSSGGVPIIVAERDAWLLNGAVRSFSEMMGLPGNQLTTTYYFPWYNNVTMDTQLRFAVP